MKMGKQLIIAGIVLASFCLATSPAQAGSKPQHRWEGVAIGVGAAMLGHAIISGLDHDHHRGHVSVHRACPEKPRHHNSHWRPHGRDRHHWYPHAPADHRAEPRGKHHDGSPPKAHERRGTTKWTYAHGDGDQYRDNYDRK